MYRTEFDDLMLELQGYDKVKTEVSLCIIDKLKKDCKTYRELEAKLDDFKRNMRYINANKYEDIIELVSILIEKEKSSLLIASHS